jgi:hypothetical protein
MCTNSTYTSLSSFLFADYTITQDDECAHAVILFEGRNIGEDRRHIYQATLFGGPVR